ncbi:MAG: response regulator [Deltaproteobacteria bacterium]|nr:response regulator [Deltaproteobacteria bacterium]MBW2049043.1 response regulator [Deltaproteobacteria bacterium]MBW2353174.1 response regulator [Deltaproteobacteria bacterium]HDZ89232.1 response regulator [Deltaproteobacteria bacterium]
MEPKKTKILIVDDEESIRTLLSISLSHKGFEVFAAEDGRKGIEIFRKETPPIVITDIKMPGMDGLELLRQIRRLDPDTRVIVITGHGDMESAVESLKLEASDFISKPVKEDVLMVAIKRAQEVLWMKARLREYTNKLELMVKENIEELKKTHDFQENLIESSIDGIIGIDRAGAILIFNRAAEGLTGHRSEDVIGHKMITEIYHPPELAREVKKKIYSHKYGGPGRLRDLEVAVATKTGDAIPIRLSATLLYKDGEEIGSVGFFQDLREIRRLQKELMEHERLSAIGQTIAGMGHYVKNILNGLEGGIYMVNTGLKRNKEQLLTRGWEIVQNNVAKISSLVMNMLSYSREHEPELEKSSVNLIAKEVFDLMEEKAGALNIDLTHDFDPAIPQCRLDAEGLHRSLLNLITNAMDACVSDRDKDKASSVIIRTLKEKAGVRIDIVDNGIGMTKEVQEKMFTRFFSTKGSKGSGFGLLVTRKIIEEQGGTIAFRSEYGKGSTFTIRLPFKERTP